MFSKIHLSSVTFMSPAPPILWMVHIVMLNQQLCSMEQLDHLARSFWFIALGKSGRLQTQRTAIEDTCTREKSVIFWLYLIFLAF